MATTQQHPLAAMQPHEALAVFYRLHSDLICESAQLADRLEDLEGRLHSVLRALDKEHVCRAALDLYSDEDPAAVAYLDSLVARATSEDSRDAG